MTRCRNREALDTCEKYNNVKFTRCCDLLKSSGQLWSPFIDSIHPQIRCPVKAVIILFYFLYYLFFFKH